MVRAPLSFMAVSIVLASCASKPPPPSRDSPLLKGVVPGFSSETTSGRHFESGEFYGRPFVVSVVGDGCEPCEQTLLAAQEMYEDHHGVSVVGVFRGDLATATKTANDLGLKFPMVSDADGQITRKFDVEDVPRTFVADSQGRVTWVGGADLTAEALTSAVENVD